MSKVTIESLYDDFTVQRKEAEYGINYELYAKLAEIKIIPRKIAEEAMEQCDFYLEHFKDQDNERAVGAKYVARQIKIILEELLRQFEEEDNE